MPPRTILPRRPLRLRIPHISKRLSAKMFTPAVARNPTDAVNVLGTPLALHSLSPITGFFRNGFCDTDKSDTGNHTLAGILTNEFLDFTAARGNDLRRAGLTNGCRWCLCVSRWKEAYEAYKAGEIAKEAVPRVVLEATHRRAVDPEERSAARVDMGMLREFSRMMNNQFWLSGGRELEERVLRDVMETDPEQKSGSGKPGPAK